MIDDVRVRVFHKGLRPTGKNSELDLVDLEGQEWIEFTQGAVTGMSEDGATGEVNVTYERDGEVAEEKFDLAVLAVGVQSLRDFKRYARAGGAQVNKYGFVERNIASLLADEQGVAFGGAICGPTTAGRSLIDAVAAASSSLAACRSTDGSAKPEPSGKQVVFACEYGLRLMGRDGSIVEALKKDGFEIGGTCPFLCYKDGRKAMMEKLQGTERLIVAGCHRQSHEALFETVLGLPVGAVTILGRGDLGDDSATSPEAGLERHTEAQAQRKAVVRPAPVVVIGGGISGLAAAGELLRRGLHVVMVEKSAEIGEPLRRAAISQGADVEVVKQFIEKLGSNPGLTVYKSAEVTSIDESDGGHTVKISAGGREDTVEAGAVLLATGSGTSVPEGYAYGESDSVVTQTDFGERITKGETPWKRVVMIQCVGARDAEHPYCSRFCCRQALVNAMLYKENNADADITILHRGMRVYGPEEELYTEAAENGITLIEIDGKPSVVVGKFPRVKAAVKRGDPVGLECDAVVLSVGHHHGESHARLAQMAGAKLDGLGFLAASDPVTDPFGTAARGIFTCGFARGPVVAEDAFVEGLGVAGEICKYTGG
jgi:heterodisulfide reductase subunit A-like polyferredoxin